MDERNKAMIMDDFYSVSIYMAEVMCDDWTMPIDEIWASYIVWPQTDETIEYMRRNSYV
jgi:hypothetical protein